MKFATEIAYMLIGAIVSSPVPKPNIQILFNQHTAITFHNDRVIVDTETLNSGLTAAAVLKNIGSAYKFFLGIKFGAEISNIEECHG